MDLYHLMEIALQEARAGLVEGEVPVGAVVASAEGSIISAAHNRPIGLRDPTAHAEILALRRAAQILGNYRLPGAVLVVTIEPCIMCMGALLNARIGHLVFGAQDPKSGAACSLYCLGNDTRLNHRIQVTSGILEHECRQLLQGFFQEKRRNKA